MTEQLFGVDVEHKHTGERRTLYVWAENVNAATHKLTGILIGRNNEYKWRGSGPEYANNKIITRTLEADNI